MVGVSEVITIAGVVKGPISEGVVGGGTKRDSLGSDAAAKSPSSVASMCMSGIDVVEELVRVNKAVTGAVGGITSMTELEAGVAETRVSVDRVAAMVMKRISV